MTHEPPDWAELREIAARAQAASQQPGWNLEAWRKLLAEAVAATNGHPEFTEFMALLQPRQ